MTTSASGRPAKAKVERVLIRGMEALAEGALRAGLGQFFGTAPAPQTELVQHLARALPRAGGNFLLAADEGEAMAMVYGAAAGGGRAMTCASGPGLARIQEGLGYMISAELPALVVDIGRSGPGFGNILASQADYFLLTRAPGPGGGRAPVLAASSVQECVDLSHGAFDLAERWKTPVILMIDATLAQMMEPVVLPARRKGTAAKRGLGGRQDRKAQVVTTTHWTWDAMAQHNYQLFTKTSEMARELMRWEDDGCGDADLVLVAFGIMGRVAKTALEKARKRGLKIGLFRPVSLWPFPADALVAATKKARAVLVLELSSGQMLDDVKLALGGKVPVSFYGRAGGEIPSPFEVMHEAVKVLS